MTRLEIAQHVADTLQKTDTDSMALLKKFVDRRYDMIWNSALWRETLGTTSYSVAASTSEVTLNSTVNFPVSIAWDENEIIPSNYEQVFQVDPGLFSDTGTPTNFIVLPKDADGNSVIRLIRTPDTAKTLLVLGKLKLVALADSDSPKISGVDNALLAFVESDMLRHLRQYGKAQVTLQEAAGQMQLMRDLETAQAAKVSRLIPSMAPQWDVNDLE